MLRTIGDVDVTNPEFIQDPYPAYEIMRREAPVYHDPKTGVYFVTTFNLVKHVLENVSLFSSVPDGSVWGVYSAHPDVVALYEQANAHLPLNTFVTSDPPHHLRYRALADKAFSALSVKHLQGLVERTCEQLIDNLAAKRECDIQQELGVRLPVAVIARIMGFPAAADETAIRRASDATIKMSDARMITHPQLLEQHRIQIETQQYFQKHIDRVRANPDDGLLSKLVHAKLDDGNGYSLRELHSVLQGLFVGGNDTTPSGLGSVILLLCRNPEFQDRIRGDADAIGRFVEEALRLESPVQGLYRFPNEDTELGGVRIPRRSALNLRYASANRDESVFERPNDIWLERKGIRINMAFGGGAHYCVGAMLARLELRTAVQQVLHRVRNLRLADPNASVVYTEKLAVRGFEHLNVRYDSEAG